MRRSALNYSWTKTGWYEWEYPFPSASGGAGGGPGQNGLQGSAQAGAAAPGAGGPAGPAIQNIGLVAITGSGSILGPQI